MPNATTAKNLTEQKTWPHPRVAYSSWLQSKQILHLIKHLSIPYPLDV